MEPRLHQLLFFAAALCALTTSGPALAQAPGDLIAGGLPDAFRAADNSDAPASAPWWESFDDTTLNELVAQAIVTNHDVASAAARLDAAGERVVPTPWPGGATQAASATTSLS